MEKADEEGLDRIKKETKKKKHSGRRWEKTKSQEYESQQVLESRLWEIAGSAHLKSHRD